MRYSKILLINPVALDEKISLTDFECSLPLNLHEMKDFLNSSNFPGNVLLLDQNILSRLDFINNLIRFQPDLAVFSPTINNYQQVLNMSIMLKKIYQSDTVLIGDYTSEFAENIFQNNDHIDYIIKEHDEFALKELAEGESLCNIYNLSYRKSSIINNNSVITYVKLTQPRTDVLFSQVNVSNLSSYNSTLSKGPEQKPASQKEENLIGAI